MWPYLIIDDNCGCEDCVPCTPSTSLCYAGPNLSCTGIQNKDTLSVALQKIDVGICKAISTIPTLQQVVNVGNTIVVPANVPIGIIMTLDAAADAYQHAMRVNIPLQTGGPAPYPDAYKTYINGQDPYNSHGFVGGFVSHAENAHNIGACMFMHTSSADSIGYESYSYDLHTGHHFIAIKSISGSPTTVCYVANNGDVHAKSFIKTGGTSSQFLKADGSTTTANIIIRSINSISTNTSAGSTTYTDYVYLCSNTITITLPTAVANTNTYVIKNTGTGVITIATTSSQTIDGSLTAPIKVQYLSLTLVSNGANWNII